MNIYLTLDYELYFGHTPGSANKCIIEPTNRLMGITERTGARMTYFIDAGYIAGLEKYKLQHPELEVDYQNVCAQLKNLVRQGNDCQLHIHPHWEDAKYENKRWVFDVSRYKLADFNLEEILDIFNRYSTSLANITGQKIHSYRAGGWCLQPFDLVKPSFEKHQIKIDSTVFPGGSNDSEMYHYDFRGIESNKPYRFENDLCEQDKNGQFMELPIAAMTYSPFFFWQLFGWGRLLPSRHKPIGDGYPIETPGSRKKLLTQKSNLPVSLDGFFSNKLNKALRNNQCNDLVIIGHPKACTLYSLEQLEKFINSNKREHSFCTFSDRIKDDI